MKLTEEQDLVYRGALVRLCIHVLGVGELVGLLTPSFDPEGTEITIEDRVLHLPPAFFDLSDGHERSDALRAALDRQAVGEAWAGPRRLKDVFEAALNLRTHDEVVDLYAKTSIDITDTSGEGVALYRSLVFNEDEDATMAAWARALTEDCRAYGFIRLYFCWAMRGHTEAEREQKSSLRDRIKEELLPIAQPATVYAQ